MNVPHDILTWERLNLLAGALEVEGALSALRILDVGCGLNRDGISKLARALKEGTSPLLQELRFGWDAAPHIEELPRNFPTPTENDLLALADMVEARANIPGCERLKILGGNPPWWLHDGSLPTLCRLLRALLPSAKALPHLMWDGAFEACFRETQPLLLTALEVELSNADSADFPWRVLQAAQALVSITFEGGVSGGILQALSISDLVKCRLSRK